MDFSAPNYNALFDAGYSTARETKRQEGLDNALATYSQAPDDPSAVAGIARYDPRTAIQIGQMQQDGAYKRQQMQATQQKAGMEQMTVMAKLLNQSTDEGTYQQSLAAARQMGLDVSKAPPQFDPAWVGQQKMIVEAFTKDGGQGISGIARELQDAGYKPGSTEFAEAMRGVINNKYATEYVDEAGNTRRRSALNLGGPPGGEGATPRPMGAPSPGQIVNGHRFKGGNPKDPASWEAAGGGGGNVTSGFRP